MQITYLFDPLCGWCYGAAPAIGRLGSAPGLDVVLAPTGLFSGENARIMEPGFAEYAWQNDQRIARLTGQVFSERYRRNVLDAAGTMFDSAPATLGLVAVGLTQPEAERDALRALQTARYVDGRDNGQLAVVAAVLAEAGFDAAAARLAAPDEALLHACRERVDQGRRLMAEFGLNGVPAVIADGGGTRRVFPSSALYGDAGQLLAALTAA